MKTSASLSLYSLIAVLLLSSCATTENHTSVKNPPPAAEVPVPPSDSKPTANVEAPVDTGAIIPLESIPTKIHSSNGKSYPYAIKTKWKGLVKSPYAQDQKLVEVHTLTSGSLARCPHTGKIFVVP